MRTRHPSRAPFAHPEAGAASAREDAARRVRAGLSAAPGVLWPAGSRLLVAASGGPDSTALLHAAVTLREALGLAGVVAGHVDHGLRPESGEDAAAVEALAATLGVPFRLARVEVGREGGRQAAARRARYRALEALRQAAGCTHVATAHTLDDQAETLLLRLTRGTSPDGLAGIPAVRDRVVRPLLEVTRADLAAWCDRHGLPVRDDPSNRDPRYRRVRVREELLPLLVARFNPAAREALGRLARLSREDAEWLAAGAEALEREALAPDGGLALAALRDAPPPLVRRVLARAWRRAAPAADDPADPLGPDPVETGALERLAELVRGAGGRRRLELPGRVRAERSLGWLHFSPRGGPAPPPSVPVAGPGRYAPAAFPGALTVEEASAPQPASADVVCLGPPPGGLVLRGWRAGDRMASAGRRVVGLLARAGIPSSRRPHVPVVARPDAAGGAVLWVPGLAVVAGAEATSGPCWRLRWTPHEG